MSYDYEHHSWGGGLVGEAPDFPRLKYELLASLVRERAPRRLLDLGCGAGKFLATLHRDFPALELTGIDRSRASIEQARRAHAGITFAVGDAGAPHFADGSFDAVVALDVLEHVDAPDSLLAHAHRLLAPQGMFHAFVPCEAHSIYWLGERLLGFHAKERVAGHIQRFTRTGLLSLVQARFEIVDIRYSFHLLGSAMDFALYLALLRPRLAEKFWRENRFYNEQPARPSLSARAMNGLLALGSAVAYAESKALARVPLLATGVHVTAVKR